MEVRCNLVYSLFHPAFRLGGQTPGRLNPKPRSTDMHIAVANWTGKFVHPALKQLADSGLTDFEPLRKAADAVPQPQSAQWMELVDCVCREAEQSRLTPGVSLERSFLQVVRTLNRDWFIRHGILLYRVPDEIRLNRDPESLWGRVRIMLGSLKSTVDADFSGGAFDTHFVRTFYPVPRHAGELPLHYDGIMGWIVIDPYALRCEFRQTCNLTSPNQRWAQFVKAKGRYSIPHERIQEYYQLRRSQFSDPATYAHWLFTRTFHEEARHAIDANRNRRNDGQGLDAYYLSLARSLLTTHAQLRQFLDAWRDDDSHCIWDKRTFCQAIGELSAQLTAAAFGQSAKLVLLEWWMRFVREDTVQRVQADRVETHAQHLLAALIGTGLVARELQCGDLPHDWQFRLDCLSVAALCRRVADADGTRLLTAVKQVFRREFAAPVDERPFSEIVEDKFLPSVAGICTPTSWDEDPEAPMRLVARRGFWSRIVFELSKAACDAGYEIEFAPAPARREIAIRVKVGELSDLYPSLWSHAFDKRNQCRGARFDDLCRLRRGDTTTLAFEPRKLRAVRRVTIDLPHGPCLW